jgi:nucleotide-binding universal stress UspA family protein
MTLKKSKTLNKHRPRSAARKKRNSIKKILTTTDFSDESRSGVRYAVALAEKLHATVSLLHVVDQPFHQSGAKSIMLAHESTDLPQSAPGRMAALVKSEGNRGVTLTSAIRNGTPFHEITTAADESAADVIVIATHGYTGPKHVVLGSTAERVVRHAPCPVLTVPTRTKDKRTGIAHGLQLKRILLPMDFSELSKDALPWATFLAEQFRAEIVLLHVVEKFPIDYLLGKELASHSIVPLIKQAEADLGRTASDLAKSFGLNISAAVREGKPHVEICETGKTLDADLIVLTTHGYTGLKHVWLGSTAERVVRHASCPVLVVREKQPCA